MLVEAFNPTFYDQLTRATYADRDGKPKEVTALEQSVRVQVATDKKGGDGEVKVEAPKDGDEWAKSDWVSTWAKCDPPLSGIDLRPYVFVTRDKRSYFGGAAGTSHLDHIVDALLGKELAVKSVEGQLTKLGILDAEQVFDAVQSRIVQGDDFSARPHGLVALAKAHVPLQRRLLDFIKAIPAAKFPGWVATGFEKVFTDNAVKEEYNQTCVQHEQGGESKQFNAARQMGASKGRKA